MMVERLPTLKLTMRTAVRRKLRAEADRYGVTSSALAREIMQRVIDEDLVGAVLDREPAKSAGGAR